MLAVEHLTAAYGAQPVLFDVSFSVGAGEVVTLIGRNGMGKTTTIHTLMGLLHATGGSVTFDGRALTKLPPYRIGQVGLGLVPEGRQVFAPLSVLDNLKLGAWTRGDADLQPSLARVCALFPMLEAILDTPAGALSGGQQQMLAIGRALMAKPRLLLLDEPSMGLAPNLVDQLLTAIRALRDDSLTILLVEQNARAALAIADRAYVLETGRVTLSGPAAEIQADRRVREAYLGI